jgi:hypothetical protein
MEETKSTKLRITFPHAELTGEQELELKKALRSAVVSVLPDMLKDQVNIQPKVNGWADDRPKFRPKPKV